MKYFDIILSYYSFFLTWTVLVDKFFINWKIFFPERGLTSVYYHLAHEGINPKIIFINSYIHYILNLIYLSWYGFQLLYNHHNVTLFPDYWLVILVLNDYTLKLILHTLLSIYLYDTLIRYIYMLNISNNMCYLNLKVLASVESRLVSCFMFFFFFLIWAQLVIYTCKFFILILNKRFEIKVW